MNMGDVDAYSKAYQKQQDKEARAIERRILAEEEADKKRKALCDEYFKRVRTLDDAISMNHTITFGKHSGKTLEHISNIDTQYLLWFIKNNIRPIKDFMLLPEDIAYGRKNYIRYVEYLKYFYPEFVENVLNNAELP